MTSRTLARATGALVMVASLSGAQGVLPIPIGEWVQPAVWAIGAGLVVWGSLRTKVDRLELEMEKRVTQELFRSTVDRMDRFEEKLDRVIEGK